MSGRQRESVCEGGSICIYYCVCEWERLSERVYVCIWESVCGRVYVRVCLCARVREGGRGR